MYIYVNTAAYNIYIDTCLYIHTYVDRLNIDTHTYNVQSAFQFWNLLIWLPQVPFHIIAYRTKYTMNKGLFNYQLLAI